MKFINPDNFHWDRLLSALRNELEVYGELLRLIDLQKECILRREPQELAESCSQLDQHTRIMRETCHNRQNIQSKCEGPGDEEKLQKIIPEAPLEMQPLLNALIDEINRLLETTRSQMQRNQLLLNKANQLNEQMRQALIPNLKIPPVYGLKGSLKKTSLVSGSQYNALS